MATPGKCHDFPINPGDRLVMLSGGGGGFGDPLNRPVEEVEADVRAGYISRKEAEWSYGVVFTAGGEIDKRRTAARKRTLARKARAKVGPAEALGGEGLVNGRRVCVAGKNVASRLGLRPGMIVELLGTNPAPLRAWVELNGAAAPGRILLDAYARTVIGVNVDGFVHVRGLDNLFPEKGTLAEGVHGGRRKR